MKIIPTYQAVHMGIKLKDAFEHPGSDDFNVLNLGTNIDGKLEFPNKERYTCIPEIERCHNEDVVVLHSGYPRPNSSLVQLYQVFRSLKDPMYSEGKVDGEKIYRPMDIDIKSKHIFYLIPSYTKQDWPDKTGSINAMQDQMEVLKDFYGVDKFFFIDWHSQGEDWTKDFDIAHVSAMDELTKFARTKGYTEKQCVDMGPDKSTERKYGIEGVEKENLSTSKRKITDDKKIMKRVKGKKVRVKDDFLLSGNSLITLGKELKKYGAKEIAALIPHALDENGFVRVNELYDDVFVCNTVDTPYARVNVRDLVFNTLQEHI